MEQTVSKKLIKKESNRVGFALLVYAIVLNIIVIGGMMLDFIISTIKNYKLLEDETAFTEMLTEVIEKQMNSGTSMIIAVIVGTGIVLAFFNDHTINKKIFESNNKMTLSSFFKVFCIFVTGQMVFLLGYDILELVLNAIGFTSESSMDVAASTSITVSMFIYAGLVGPIIEELIYRGFVLHYLKRFGKIPAIIVSSLVFGVMHCNIPQSIGACYMGFIFAYIALEYSIWWSMALHIINNMVLGDLLSYALSGLSEKAQYIIIYGIIIGFSIIGYILIFKSRRKLIEFFKKEKHAPNTRYILTSIGMIIFIISQFVTAVSLLEKI